MPSRRKSMTQQVRVPFSLACSDCDAGTEITSAAEAIRLGWRGIVRDDGIGWNYLGQCPQCIEDERQLDVEAICREYC